MHVIFRESHGLDETETPTDLGQSPADLVVLSLSDSDLGAFAAGWHRATGGLPTLRLANIAALKHPLSVDTYIEQTLAGAKGILIRLIGGVPYWPYGLQQIEILARQKGIALAVLPADGRADPRLDEISTLPVSTLRRLQHLCDGGGAVAAQAALAQLSLAAGIYAPPVAGRKDVPDMGYWMPETGVLAPQTDCPADAVARAKPLCAVVFYRSYVVSADLGAVEALFDALRGQGFAVMGLFAPSLKAPKAAQWLEDTLKAHRPSAIVNATSFSGRRDGGASPLDAAGVPVFQVALSTATQDAWEASDRGLSPADLAMHVVLPEVDGRVFGGVVSFKEPQARDPALEFSRFMHRAVEPRVHAAARRVRAWVDLGRKPASQRQPAIVLSTYPGRAWNMAHAVGLDAVASAGSIAADLGVEIPSLTARDLQDARLFWPLAEYQASLAKLPPKLQHDLETAWGPAETSPDIQDGAIALPVLTFGRAIIALQPERGDPDLRDDQYHDLARVPRHGYVAFYLWLQSRADVMIHVGAHGTLEWLPGKAVALSERCWPDALVGTLPVIYPFIVNDPGEAAQAKRRIGAVTLGHIPPPLKTSGLPDRMAPLEALLDEFSNADGLDPKRRDRLVETIRLEAQALGVEADLGLKPEMCSAEAITRIDRFVCDIKDSQFGDGLHIWGRSTASQNRFDTAPAVAQERQSIPDALAGQRIAAGPAGSPYRGRSDVLPTGRNLFAVDPRAVPTKSAFAQGRLLAEELVRRHMQDEGDWLRSLVVDLWGSATMRTAGEEFAMAWHLMGLRPRWDDGSERVGGFEIVPIAELDRPRVDVTLRLSGLFRDVFPGLPVLFAQAVDALSQRDEAPDWNPYVADGDARVFGPKPGSYGVAMGALWGDYSEAAKQAAGEAWLAASSWAYDQKGARADLEGITRRVADAQGFVHVQDMAETDVLLSEDYAAHEAGFAAAQSKTGGRAALYHLDSSDPTAPKARALTEEIARVVRSRASHPGWIAGMRRHGFRGAAEIASTLENLAAFAQLADVVPSHLFDLYYDATLADDDVRQFLAEANPQALAAMRDRFAALQDAGLWETRRNSLPDQRELAG